MLKNLAGAFEDACITIYLYYSMYVSRLYDAAEERLAKTRGLSK